MRRPTNTIYQNENWGLRRPAHRIFQNKNWGTRRPAHRIFQNENWGTRRLSLVIISHPAGHRFGMRSSATRNGIQ
jgi:ribosomal protein S6